MNREDVGAILRDVLESAERAGVEPGDMSFRVEGDYLAALCRLWLAVEDAPVGRLDIVRDDFDDAEVVEIVMDPNHVSHLQYQRVRIVPEQGEVEP